MYWHWASFLQSKQAVLEVYSEQSFDDPSLTPRLLTCQGHTDKMGGAGGPSRKDDRRKKKSNEQHSHPDSAIKSTPADVWIAEDPGHTRVRVNRAIAFLLRASKILSNSLDIDRNLHTLAREVVPSVADIFSIDLANDAGAIESTLELFSVPDLTTSSKESSDINSARILWNDVKNRLTEEVTQSGVPLLLSSRELGIATSSDQWGDAVENLQSIGVVSIAVVPVSARGGHIGAMIFATGKKRKPLDQKDMAMLVELGRRTASALDNARLFAAAERAREESQRANKAKGDFLAAMSHELRTPLNAIAGYCQLMLMGLRGHVTDEQREDLKRIADNQHHLLGLINSILNYAKLDGGAVSYEMAHVSVSEVLNSVEPLIEPQLRASKLHFEYNDSAEDVKIVVDEEKLRQILLNLVSNAIKFTPENGTVRAGYRVSAGHVHMYVSDTGVGIPANKLERVFDPFVQIGRTHSTIHEGIGLGLSISRDLARAMGGDILVKSESGKGSTFIIVFPIL